MASTTNGEDLVAVVGALIFPKSGEFAALELDGMVTMLPGDCWMMEELAGLLRFSRIASEMVYSLNESS